MNFRFEFFLSLQTYIFMLLYCNFHPIRLSFVDRTKSTFWQKVCISKSVRSCLELCISEAPLPSYLWSSVFAHRADGIFEYLIFWTVSHPVIVDDLLLLLVWSPRVKALLLIIVINAKWGLFYCGVLFRVCSILFPLTTGWILCLGKTRSFNIS